jgi:hypothetical protein
MVWLMHNYALLSIPKFSDNIEMEKEALKFTREEITQFVGELLLPLLP